MLGFTVQSTRGSSPTTCGSSGPREAPTPMTRAEAAAFAEQQRAAGRRVVFTNGVFDILHPGHIRYLRQARALGDVLIVGLNADASVRRNKGPARPVNSEQDRAEVLAALECMDAVAVFDE